MWHSNDMFHYVLKAEFVTLVSLKGPSSFFFSNAHLRKNPSSTFEQAVAAGRPDGRKVHFFCTLQIRSCPSRPYQQPQAAAAAVEFCTKGKREIGKGKGFPQAAAAAAA